jgi:hypothetical protein
MAAAAAAAAGPAHYRAAVVGSARFPGITLAALDALYRGVGQFATAKNALRGGDLRLVWLGDAHVEGFVHSKKLRQLFYFAQVHIGGDSAPRHACGCQASYVTRIKRGRSPRARTPLMRDRASSSGACSHTMALLLALALLNQVRVGVSKWPTGMRPQANAPKFIKDRFPQAFLTLGDALARASSGFSDEETGKCAVQWAFNGRKGLAATSKVLVSFGVGKSHASHATAYQAHLQAKVDALVAKIGRKEAPLASPRKKQLAPKAKPNKAAAVEAAPAAASSSSFGASKSTAARLFSDIEAGEDALPSKRARIAKTFFD